MADFYLQKGYEGREANMVRFSQKNYIGDSSYIFCEPRPHIVLVGTVEWIDNYFINYYNSTFVPDYYPHWTKSIWHRKIAHGREGLKGVRRQFIKPSDKYKRFDPYIISLQNNGTAGPLEELYFANGPFVCSEVVEFVNEWRYYISNGEVLASWWYQGDEEDSEKDPNGPKFPIDIPKDYCGAVDLGILTTGELALVEAHHPYSIGWYGDNTQRDREVYIKFLEDGWKYLCNDMYSIYGYSSIFDLTNMIK